MTDWMSKICKDMRNARAANPGYKIIIQISPLMNDYLYYHLVESNKYLKAEFEKHRNKLEDDTNAPVADTLFGCQLEVVDGNFVPTYSIIIDCGGTWAGRIWGSNE